VTPLTVAAEDGFEAVVRVLLKRGADPNLEDKAGLTPLMYAAAPIDRGNTEILKALLASGARASARAGDDTALSFAQRYGNRQAASLLQAR
jgi:ankyrin repeat protein